MHIVVRVIHKLRFERKKKLKNRGDIHVFGREGVGKKGLCGMDGGVTCV
jgi:hypothetical protein